jgi:serine/threonine protein kinase
MIYENSQDLRQRISEVTRREPGRKLHVFEDTSQFMSINPGDVLRLTKNDYLVIGQAREGRFGIDEQPKFWVKTAIDLTTGEKKIIKLVFHETFNISVGNTVFLFSRSPKKESEVLQKMSDHPNFMHGQSVRDTAGNLVRIIDFISGSSLYEYLRRLKISHEDFYRQMLSKMMKSLIECIKGIIYLHKLGLQHGYIRADHIILKSNSDTYVWIDFDYDVSYPDYDLFCLGNILLQVVGKGRHSIDNIRLRPSDYPGFASTLTSSDMSLMFPHRVANLRKLYPHISKALNGVLMRFSIGNTNPYKNMASLLDDLRSLFPSVGC